MKFLNVPYVSKKERLIIVNRLNVLSILVVVGGVMKKKSKVFWKRLLGWKIGDTVKFRKTPLKSVYKRFDKFKKIRKTLVYGIIVSRREIIPEDWKTAQMYLVQIIRPKQLEGEDWVVAQEELMPWKPRTRRELNENSNKTK